MNPAIRPRVRRIMCDGVLRYLDADRIADIIIARRTTCGMPDAFETFRAIVLGDAALQERLAAIADERAFIDACIATGAEHGLVLSPEQVRGAMTAGQQAWLMHRMAGG